MSAFSYESLKAHVGHQIVCVEYGGYNVAIECEDCCEVLLDFDKPQPAKKKAKDKTRREFSGNRL